MLPPLRKLILVGRLDAHEMASLGAYCQRLYAAGVTELRLDISAVTNCRRAGLDGLVDLAGGSAKVAISIDGAYWGQFIDLLRSTPTDELRSVCESVSTLVPEPRSASGSEPSAPAPEGTDASSSSRATPRTPCPEV
ncbi:hypothetical protein [Actinomycetospora lemnae]|uniref:STAS domain-containing protein n=1 Tax=Actinomycetospora lemnae TaxID=3019891 RepID=A0ABT5T2C1_9PSEU|nr:hypothetical protein [Actinomycetospora sp. DW7H6]MDD7968088.1 hypothetical protein [Actinomycetospora sp. DW7H6]